MARQKKEILREHSIVFKRIILEEFSMAKYFATFVECCGAPMRVNDQFNLNQQC